MIIDVHYHLIPTSRPVEISKEMEEELLRVAKVMGITINKERLIQESSELWADIDGQKLINTMNDVGIDYTIICHVDDADNKYISFESSQRGNERISNIAKKYPNRLMSLAGVDPRRPEALDMLKQCFEEFGMKGLKYHPDNGFDPCSPESYLLLEYLEKNNGILLTHTGPLPKKRSKFSEPMLLSDILVDFPNLKIIAAHMGQVNWRSWASLAMFHPNLYGDLAMWGYFAFGRFDLFCRELRNIIDYVGVEHILFGSDGPIFDVILPIKDLIEKIKNLPNKAPKGIKFTKEEIDAILGNNAANLLKLS